MILKTIDFYRLPLDNCCVPAKVLARKINLGMVHGKFHDSTVILTAFDPKLSKAASHGE